MPLAKKETGYPVDSATAAAATAEPPKQDTKAAEPQAVKSTVQPSAKDRSIVRQVAWKIAGPALVNWTGSPEAWFEKCLELRAKIEKDILEA